jgi:uncharacterized membrane protein
MLRTILHAALVAFYFAAGVLHLTAPDKFLPIMPDFVPWPRQVVLATGVWEIIGAGALLVPRLRFAAAIAMAVYAVAVFPANIKHAFDMVPVAGLPSSWWYHGPRLLLQPVIVWWALYAGGVIDWPFASVRRRG